MGTASRLRGYRIRAGKSAAEIAQQLGINHAWYRDLEHRDEELASTLTLFQALELASLLHVRLQELLEEDPCADEEIPLTELPLLIERHLARTGVSIDQFESQVGWDVRELMHSPLTVIAESPIAFLQALARHLGINWLSLVPGEDAVG